MQPPFGQSKGYIHTQQEVIIFHLTSADAK